MKISQMTCRNEDLCKNLWTFSIKSVLGLFVVNIPISVVLPQNFYGDYIVLANPAQIIQLQTHMSHSWILTWIGYHLFELVQFDSQHMS